MMVQQRVFRIRNTVTDFFYAVCRLSIVETSYLTNGIFSHLFVMLLSMKPLMTLMAIGLCIVWHNSILLAQTKWQKNIEESLTALTAQDTLRAEKLLRSALQVTKDTGDVYLYRGTQRSILRDYRGALADMNLALGYINTSTAYMMRGQIFSALNQYDEAELDFDIAVNLDTANPLAYMYRGINYSKLRRSTQATVDFDKALALAPHNLDIELQKAFALIRLQESQSALRLLDSIIQRHPSVSEAYFVRGSLYRDMQEEAKSCADWKTSAELGYRGAMSMIRQFCSKNFSAQVLDSLSSYTMETVEVQGERVSTEIVLQNTKNLAFRGERSMRLMQGNFNPATIFGGRTSRLAQGAGSLSPGGNIVGLPDMGYCSSEATRTTDLGVDCLIVLLRENVNALNDDKAREIFRRLLNLRNQLRETLNGFTNSTSSADRVRTPALAVMEQMGRQLKELLVYVERIEKERQ
jgi:tetratricopeptide (TPR) repeat protein